MENASDDPCEPITLWIRQLEKGHLPAAQPLWNHFCERLMEMARGRLGAKLRRTYDEEDAAVSAFHSLCRVISEKRSTDLGDRIDLWKLLFVITERKIANRIRGESSRKRSISRTLEDTSPQSLDRVSNGLEGIEGREPTPAFAAEFADMCESLLESLGDESLRDIARFKLNGLDSTEIAAELGCSKRTVERRLLIVRRKWENRYQELNADVGTPFHSNTKFLSQF